MERPPDNAKAQIAALSDAFSDLCHGKHSVVVGGAIADVLSIWLCGHFDPSGQAETDAVREHLLQDVMALTRKLVPVNERIIAPRQAAQQEHPNHASPHRRRADHRARRHRP
jgi:hypothetical protein